VVPRTDGGLDLPQYHVIPRATLPRVIREAERPAAVDLSAYVPTPCNQGNLNSCVGFAGGFGLMTYLAATNVAGWTGLDTPERQFSPAFVFNQINSFRMGTGEHDSCETAGSRIKDLFTLLRDTGCTTWEDVPYSVDDCDSVPSAAARNRAAEFRILYDRDIPHDLAEVQSYLNNGQPVLFVAKLDESFFRVAPGIVFDTVNGSGDVGLGHAMLAVGYDDGVGAIKVMNSWGRDWGDGGFAFVSYGVWATDVREAYVTSKTLFDPAAPAESADATDATRTLPGRAQQFSVDRPCLINPMLDTDGDGYPDTLEIEFADFGFDPTVPDPNPDFVPRTDTDRDGWPDVTEVAFGTDPRDRDDFPFDCDYIYPGQFFADADVLACIDRLLFDVRTFDSGGPGPRGLAAADFDGDGVLDVAVANNDFDATGEVTNVVILPGNGDGLLGSPIIVAARGSPRYVTAADLNGDDVPDLLFTDELGDTIHVLLNAGDGSFTSVGTQTVTGGSGPVAVTDVNGDDVPDLIAPATSDTSIFLGSGDGTFGAPLVIADVGLSRTPVVAADFDGDDAVDLVGYTQVGGNYGVAVLLGAGDGTFIAAEFVDLAPLEVGVNVPIALAVGDFNGDGLADVAAAAVADLAVTLLLGAGDGTLPTQVDVSTTAVVVQPDGLVIFDVDADGADDLALASQIGDAVILWNLDEPGAAAFAETRVAIPPEEGASIATVAAGDLNNDGEGDLIVSAAAASRVATLRNVCEATGFSPLFFGLPDFELDPSTTLFRERDGRDGDR